jgi:hypothetical protein
MPEPTPSAQSSGQLDLAGPSLLTMDGFYYAITVDPHKDWKASAVQVVRAEKDTMEQIVADLMPFTIERLKETTRSLGETVAGLRAERETLRDLLRRQGDQIRFLEAEIERQRHA